MIKYIQIPALRFIMAALVLGTAVVGCTDKYDAEEGIRLVSFRPTASNRLITAGQKVIFVDSSLTANTRQWTFDGGIPATSTEKKVTVTYPEASPSNDTGANFGYAATLEVTNDDGSTENGSFNIVVFPKIVADFAAANTEVFFGTSTTFSDNSTASESQFDEAKERDSLAWTFEGGNPSFSNEANPVVSYSEVGTYDVSLYIYRQAPKDSVLLVKRDFVTVTDVDCADSPNLLNCFNFNIEDDNLTSFNASSESAEPLDRNFNLSVTDAQSTGEGSNSLLYKYREPAGTGAFTAHFIDFVSGMVAVTEAGSYTISIDHYGEVIDGTEYVMLLGAVNMDDGVYTSQFLGRFPQDTWANSAITLDNLPPGNYFIRVQMFNPGYNNEQRIDFYMDNFMFMKN